MIPVPEQALALARHFEGLFLKAYICPAGVPTVGYGATGADVRLGMTVSKEWAEDRLVRDMGAALRQSVRLCPVLLLEPEERLAAIADFTFNLGSARLASSTLRKRINEQDWSGAAEELKKWVWGGGRKLPGLVTRRQRERELLLAA